MSLTARWFRILAVLAAGLLVLSACGGGDDDEAADVDVEQEEEVEETTTSSSTTTTEAEATTTEATGGAAGATELTLVAENISFDQEQLSVPAGEEITITYDNQDDGIPHNLRIMSPDEPQTEITEGPVTQTLTFTIAEPGSYTYICDVHPDQMRGTLTVQ